MSVRVVCYGKPLSHLFDKPILQPTNLLQHFDHIGLLKPISRFVDQ